VRTRGECLIVGQHRSHFVPQIIRQLLEVTFVPSTELRKATLPIVYDVLECQQQKTGDLHEVRKQLIGPLVHQLLGLLFNWS